MTDIDISPEAVERLACLLQDWGQHDEGAINDARDDAANALRALSAALTQSRAETAAAYEVAATCTEWTAWGERHNLTDASRAAIRALATPDQTAALDKLIAEAEALAVEKADLTEKGKKYARSIYSNPQSDFAAIREAALIEAAELVRSTAYTSSGDNRSLEPVATGLAGMDMHHATIAAAILALIGEKK